LADTDEAARAELHAEIQQRANAIGPTDDDDFVAEPGDMWMLSEWVLVANWVNVNDGNSRLVRLGSPDLLSHHRAGLLHEALFTDWGESVG
jgi:hypothetical protein